ncbi:DUF2510 domain-containing protein [Schaalia sp. ZJ405]|uniref:DUF2510 domain-containing protein n=1 Tax=Schaalia sp. ZJ405 TaxID=2709403 RepID=UPI0013E9F021|nr:DUF2510 domain-containing protein [Schaalia sp. ZJ405]QPK81075.1 DUF2510 domain-containing protein [Schaalia sp. ZJ405]
MSTPERGWYPDPENPRKIRWWDGDSWTTQVADLPSSASATSVESSWDGDEDEAAAFLTPGGHGASPVTHQRRRSTASTVIWVFAVFSLVVAAALWGLSLVLDSQISRAESEEEAAQSALEAAQSGLDAVKQQLEKERQ